MLKSLTNGLREERAVARALKNAGKTSEEIEQAV